MKINSFLMLFLVAWSRGFSLDTTGTVVILSPKVGAEINLAERNELRLFFGERDFLSAGILQRPDSSYVFLVTSQKGGGRSGSVPWLESTKLEIDSIRHIIDDYPQMPAETAVESCPQNVTVVCANDTLETASKKFDMSGMTRETRPFDFLPRLFGFRIGYRKYMYKTHEIAYEGSSFLFTKRPHDNYLLSGFGVWPIRHGVVFMPSFEWWKTACRPGYILNADLAYHPFMDRRFHQYVGLGLGLQRVSETFKGGYGSSDSRHFRLNVFSGFHYEASRHLWISFEVRFLGEPIIAQAGLSYHPGKILFDLKDKPRTRKFFYTLFYIGLVISSLGFIIASAMPYS